MILKTAGIVIRIINFSDSGIVANIYTRNFGMQSFLVRGIKKPKSALPGNCFQPLTPVDLVLYHHDSKTLKRIKDISPGFRLKTIRDNGEKSMLALFMSEIIYRSVKEECSHPELFDFLFETIREFDALEKDFRYYHVFFMARLTRLLGFMPDTSNYKSGYSFDLKEGIFIEAPAPAADILDENLCSGFHTVLTKPYRLNNLDALSPVQRKNLLDAIIRFYELHLDHPASIRSHRVLLDVLEP